MPLNPYARFVGGQDPLSVMAETAGKLRELVARIGPDKLEKSPAPGKWSPREILCHLADTELAHAFRLRQTLAEPHHIVQPFDQDEWAKQYASISAVEAVEAFAAIRAWNLALLAGVPKETYTKPVSHPERGAMTFFTLLETMAGHDVNHLTQFEALAAQAH